MDNRNKPFLDLLAASLYEKHGRDLSGCCIVFPNRRAGLFFRKYLAERSGEAMWSPAIMGISEFITGLSDLLPADPIDLIFELYGHYTALVNTPETIDEFWFWGEMMITDFDEIDKYRVDAAALFTNIREIKEIDDRFGGLEPEQVAFIRQFWSSFYSGGTSSEKEGFMGIWEILPRVYKRFRESLMQKGTAYEGMIYRDVAENFSTFQDRLQWKEVVFAGFNALNSCEKRIFTALRNNARASFYWDYDLAYLNNRHEEAGRFMRDNLKEFPPPPLPESFDHYNDEKDLRIFDLPGDILQTRTLGGILSESGAESSRFSDTAVVLCDENLLIPVLSSIPPGVEEINVTMGYPLLSTPVFGLAEALLALQAGIRVKNNAAVRFYHKEVESILFHQYVRFLIPDRVKDLNEKMVNGNMIYVEQQEFTSELELLIFRQVTDHIDFCNYFSSIFSHISELLFCDTENRVQAELEKEYIFILNSRLNKLRSLLDGREVSLVVFSRLFRKMLRSQRMPFTGEPLAGLQVMGILETRLLDFRHVIMLSVNEEIMPAPHRAQSFIPWTMRYAFKMPSREELDAIYAYYFHRLIQRAEKVDLLYNSSSEGIRNGEMSRYLYQLLFKRGVPVIRPSVSLLSGETKPVLVEKGPEVYARLEDYLVDAGGEARTYLSPSALNAYIDCPLRFYFRYIAGIGEEDEVLEEVDNIWFGTLLHETMWRLYEECKGADGSIGAESLDELLRTNRPEMILEQVFREKFFRGRANAVPEGRNLIIFRVILKYIRKIIATDRRLAPLEEVKLELAFRREYNTGSYTVRLGGKIDRIDRIGGMLRILDYKTGNAEMRFSSVENLFDSSAANRNKAAFQTFLYAWIYNDEKVTPGLYVIRNIFSGDFGFRFITGTHGDKHEILSYSEVAPEFEQGLDKLIRELFSRDLPFSQTSETAHCRSCDFNKICRR
ncbi:MAG: PD-(D/E)XK nuclease family protein [Bacteroidota bacterium]